MLPRLATALSGEVGERVWLCCSADRGCTSHPWCPTFSAATQLQALLCCSSSAAAQEQRRLAVAFYHAKQKVELLRPSGTAEAAAGGSSMAVDAGA